MRPITASAMSRAGLVRGAPPRLASSLLPIFSMCRVVNPRISINSRTTRSPRTSVYPANVRPMCLKTSLMRPRCNSKFVQGLGAPHTTPNLCRVYILELMGTNTTTDSGGGGLTRIHTYHAQPPPVSSDAILTKNSHIRDQLGVGLCGC